MLEVSSGPIVTLPVNGKGVAGAARPSPMRAGGTLDEVVVRANLDLISNQNQLIEEQKRLLQEQGKLIEEKSKLIQEKTKFLEKQSELLDRNLI